MDTKTLALAISLLIFLDGCATTTKSTLLGAAIGGAAGGAVGQSASHNSQGTMIGLAVGAGVGSLIGYFAHKNNEAKNVKSTPATNDDEIPSLTKAKIRSVEVPDMIEGNKYIKKHKVYILEDAGSWSKE